MVTSLFLTAEGAILPKKGKEKLDLNEKWREVERELDEFSEAIENDTEKGKRVK